MPGKPGVYVCPVAIAEVTRDAEGRLRRAPDALHSSGVSLWHFGRLASRLERRSP
jgi:hypothetical protein